MKSVVPSENIKNGNASFEYFRRNNYIYVDKTKFIYNLVRRGADSDYIFISRPRRFGKSLMCSTLDALFSGKKELFEGLYIAGTDYDFKKYPILHFDFSQMKSASYDTFLSVFQNMIKKSAAENGIGVDISDPQVMLINVLDAADNPVIIIDEFDSPMIEVVSTGDKELAEKMRSTFNSFYTIIKSYTANIRFFFITGCTKLSGMSIFSAMNNLKDISRMPEYAGMFGYTEEELEKNFSEYIDKKFADERCSYKSRNEFLDALREYYDGYRFSPDSDLKVYNPVSVGNYFSDSRMEFQNFWMDTGGMSTLAVTLARQADLLKIVDAHLKVNLEKINNFDIIKIAEHTISPISIYVLLYYAGYLTIVDYKAPGRIFLDFPNIEVRSTFLSSLASTYCINTDEDPGSLAEDAMDAAKAGDVRAMLESVNEYYRIFNYSDYQGYKEQVVKILFKAFFAFMRGDVMTEIPAGDGRIDAVLRVPGHNYLLEFKVDGKSSDDARNQIEEKRYADLFTFNDSPLHLVGVDFRTDKRQIETYTHQIYGQKKIDRIKLD